MKLRALALGLLLLFGMGRLRFEQQLTLERRVAYFHSAELSLDLRQKLGQMGFLAALSGFRAMVADILWIEANSAWQRVEWGRMKLLFDTVTALQPRAILFWRESYWHMAYNASVAALEDRRRQPREALRIKAQREYFKIGEDYLLRGIANNPDRWELYVDLGTFYRDKLNDHSKSAEAFAKGAEYPAAPAYVKRCAAYQLAMVPGSERAAYNELLRLYKMGASEHLPSLILRLHELEEMLKVPTDQRIPVAAPQTKP